MSSCAACPVTRLRIFQKDAHPHQRSDFVEIVFGNRPIQEFRYLYVEFLHAYIEIVFDHPRVDFPDDLIHQFFIIVCQIGTDQRIIIADQPVGIEREKVSCFVPRFVLILPTE